MILYLQIAYREGIFEQEQKTMKLRISELEKKVEEATRNLAAAQSTIAAKDKELSALQNNLRELEDLKEMKEVQSVGTNLLELQCMRLFMIYDEIHVPRF